jgi:hypothetical protein
VRSSPLRAIRPSLLLSVALAAQAGALGLSAQETVLEGTLLYEKIPVTPAGLLPKDVVPTPAGRIRVEVIAAGGDRVLAGGFTDEKGGYRLAFALDRPTRLFLRAVSRTENAAVVRVVGREPFAVAGPPRDVSPGETVAEDLLVLEERRLAGAFNIAVVVGRANALLRSVDPLVELLDVEIRWDTAYAGGTFFRERDGAAFINGDRSRDSDEFDDHVILHEYAHFLMAAHSRESSPGGDHSGQERLDPRLAWSEGWANFFAAAVLDDPRYLDTGARDGRQIVRVAMDLERNVHPREQPGIWSEHSVGSLLWDWYDDGLEEDDALALGFAPLWETLVALRKVPDVYLLHFVDSLAARVKDPVAMRLGLLARDIEYDPADPAARAPFPTPISAGAPVHGQVDSRTSLRGNVWGASSHYAFRLDEPRAVSIQLHIVAAEQPSRSDLDLYLFDADGEQVANSIADNGVGGTETIARTLPAGYYRIEVRSWSGGSGGRLEDGRAHEGSYVLTLKY